MSDRWPVLRAALQANYAFRQLDIVQPDPLLVQTERGLKKVRFWTDERLLQRHIDWRRRLSGGEFFVDRMYATVYGDLFIRFDRAALTCHDAPFDRARIDGNEALWAETLCSLFKRSRGSRSSVVRTRTPVAQQVTGLYARLTQLDGRGALTRLLRACYPSALERAETADQLRRRHLPEQQCFTLPQQFSLRDSRQVLGTLFLELGQSLPVEGFKEVSRFFVATSIENEPSAQKLLGMASERGAFAGTNGELLLAEWFSPQEWIETVAASDPIDAAGEQANIAFLKQTWDAKVRLIRFLTSQSGGMTAIVDESGGGR
ncbi:MAG: hypothetical protein ABF868_12365 [Sporolactobacillus sp.]